MKSQDVTILPGPNTGLIPAAPLRPTDIFKGKTSPWCAIGLANFGTRLKTEIKITLKQINPVPSQTDLAGWTKPTLEIAHRGEHRWSLIPGVDHRKQLNRNESLRLSRHDGIRRESVDNKVAHTG